MKRLAVLVVVLICAMILGYAVLKAEESGAASNIVDTASDIVYDKVFNRKPGTMPILPSYTISDYKELYQHPAIPEEVPEKYHKYLRDNNLYATAITFKDDTVYICKDLRYGKGQHILYTTVDESGLTLNHSWADSIRKAMNEAGKDYKCIKKEKIASGLTMYVFDVTELRGKATKPRVFNDKPGGEGMLRYMSLRDDKGTELWNRAYDDRDVKNLSERLRINDDRFILTAKKLADGKYMLVERYDSGVLYVDATESPKVVECYSMNCATTQLIGAGRFIYPKEGSILTDNVVRLKYDDGVIRHVRVRQSTKDVIQNLIARDEMNCPLLWINKDLVSKNKELMKEGITPYEEQIKAHDFNKVRAIEPAVY